MRLRKTIGWAVFMTMTLVMPAVPGLVSPDGLHAQAGQAGGVTFTKDIAPILQRSCENCHHADGVAPMSLSTYEEVRPWARAIKQRTGVGPHAGVMPPWYMEKNIGIQKYKDDPSLSDEEVARIAKWVDSGAPRGNPADMPAARHYDDSVWHIGTPDLIVKTKDSQRSSRSLKTATSWPSRSRKSTTRTPRAAMAGTRWAGASSGTT